MKIKKSIHTNVQKNASSNESNQLIYHSDSAFEYLKKFHLSHIDAEEYRNIKSFDFMTNPNPNIFTIYEPASITNQAFKLNHPIFQGKGEISLIDFKLESTLTHDQTCNCNECKLLQVLCHNWIEVLTNEEEKIQNLIQNKESKSLKFTIIAKNCINPKFEEDIRNNKLKLELNVYNNEILSVSNNLNQTDIILNKVNENLRHQKKRKSKPRKIRNSLIIVHKWLNLTVKDPKNKKEQKITKSEASSKLGIPKKSLDYYFTYIKKGIQFKFPFEQYMDSNFGKLKQWVDDRKAIKNEKNSTSNKSRDKLLIIETIEKLAQS